MQPMFLLAPRYRLDDELPWLEGVDPVRNYWLYVNGDQTTIATIPGCCPASFDEFKATMQRFRSLQPGEHLCLDRASDKITILCITNNCYAIDTEFRGAPVWHLFDQETLETLLMTAHPDWICSPKDVDLGRRLLSGAFAQAIAA